MKRKRKKRMSARERRKAYWDRRLRQERHMARAPLLDACRKAWFVIQPDHSPDEWDPRKVPERIRNGPVWTAMIALWGNLASGTKVIDWVIQQEYEPFLNTTMNETVALFEALRRTQKRMP